MPNCIGPAAPAWFQPERTPGSRVRPWSDSTLPTAASTAQDSPGPSRRHVAMVVGRGRMVEAPARGVPVRVTGLREGSLGAVRPRGDR